MLQDTLLSHHSFCLLTLPNHHHLLLLLLLLLLLFLPVTMHHRPGDTEDSAAARNTRRMQGQTLCEVFGEDRTPWKKKPTFHSHKYIYMQANGHNSKSYRLSSDTRPVKREKYFFLPVEDEKRQCSGRRHQGCQQTYPVPTRIRTLHWFFFFN